MPFANPEYLVETDWLEENLGDPTLRVLDCTTILRPDDRGTLQANSGRDSYAQEHIPGAGYADLVGDLSDRNTKLRFMMPPAPQFAEAMSRYGVGEGTRVVLYDSATGSWATRIWWMLRAFGFENTAVLNGGLTKWKQEGRAVSDTSPSYPQAEFVPRLKSDMIADKEEVLQAVVDGAACVINALGEEQDKGNAGPNRYGRVGRIPNSVNVPARSTIDPETNTYIAAESILQSFTDVGATPDGRVIAYCGGGIAASNNAFLLAMLGYENVAVYDGSLSEWAADPNLPLETG